MTEKNCRQYTLEQVSDEFPDIYHLVCAFVKSPSLIDGFLDQLTMPSLPYKACEVDFLFSLINKKIELIH